MKRKILSLMITGGLLLIAIPAWLLLTGCREDDLPVQLTGTWSGMEMLTVRNSDGLFSFQFTKSPAPVPMYLTIQQNGIVDGTIGNAVLNNCKASRNRGWLGRKINIKTDFIIRGNLTGAIFEGDPLVEKIISVPFNCNGDEMEVTLFQKKNGVYPMSVIQFKKINE